MFNFLFLRALLRVIPSCICTPHETKPSSPEQGEKGGGGVNKNTWFLCPFCETYAGWIFYLGLLPKRELGFLPRLKVRQREGVNRRPARVPATNTTRAGEMVNTRPVRVGFPRLEYRLAITCGRRMEPRCDSRSAPFGLPVPEPTNTYILTAG